MFLHRVVRLTPGWPQVSFSPQRERWHWLLNTGPLCRTSAVWRTSRAWAWSSWKRSYPTTWSTTKTAARSGSWWRGSPGSIMTRKTCRIWVSLGYCWLVLGLHWIGQMKYIHALDSIRDLHTVKLEVSNLWKIGAWSTSHPVSWVPEVPLMVLCRALESSSKKPSLIHLIPQYFVVRK